MLTKKGKGRPKKQPISIESTESIHINVENVIPPSKIVRTTQEANVEEDKFILHIVCNCIDFMTKVVDVIHGICEDTCIMSFDSSGIVFQKKSKTNQCDFDVRIFADKMVSFYCPERVAIKLDQTLLLKILKNFKDSESFTFFIYRSDIPDNELKLETFDSKSNVRRTYRLNYVNIDPSELDFDTSSALSADNYEFIIILNSTYFSRECKDMKNLCQQFEIFCNNSTFQIQINKDNMKYRGIQGMSDTIKYVKRFEESFQSINSELSTILVNDYIKCETFSKIVKFYFSNNKKIPTILEYDIDPGMGVFQAYLH